MDSSSTSSDESIEEYDSHRAERRKFTDIYDVGRICRETLKMGDEIQYYDPMGIVGNIHNVRTAIVTGITPDCDYIVHVSTGDPITCNRPVRRVRERNSDGDLVAINEKCRWRSSAHFRCDASGSTTASADSIIDNAKHITEVLHRTNNLLQMVGVSAVDLRTTPKLKSKQTSKDSQNHKIVSNIQTPPKTKSRQASKTRQKRKNVSNVIYILCVDVSLQVSLMICSFLQYDSKNYDGDFQFDSDNNDDKLSCDNDDQVYNSVCLHRRNLREAATVNVQKQAEKVVKRLKKYGHANYKVDDVVQIVIPINDRAKTDPHCLIGVVVEVLEKSSTCRIATKGGVLDRCIAYHYLKQLPPESNDVILHDLETELQSWKGLPKISLRTASRMQSMVGGQGFSKCTCKGKCDSKRCGCLKKGLNCTARCHKGNKMCTNCKTDSGGSTASAASFYNNNNNNNNNNDHDSRTSASGGSTASTASTQKRNNDHDFSDGGNEGKDINSYTVKRIVF